MGLIVYIGDFDFTNENVQSFLVRNNGKIFTNLGYRVAYIGVNRKQKSLNSTKQRITKKVFDDGNFYLELPDTLNLKGILSFRRICKIILSELDSLNCNDEVDYVVTYQSPTYSYLLKYIGKWCKKNTIPYIVNCADLPIFSQQKFIRRIIMKINWEYMHKVNKKYSNGVISVSKYIQNFYKKENCAYIIIPPLFDDTCIDFDNFTSNKVATFVFAGTPFKFTGSIVKTDSMKDRLDLIIDYFYELSLKGINYKFAIAGITKDDYIVSVPRQKEILDNCLDIEFYGCLDHKHTMQIVANSDFSISYRVENTMTKAGFPTKVVESISVGTPVIMNRISDVFDYLVAEESIFELSHVNKENVMLIEKLCLLTPNERKNIKDRVVLKGIFNYGRYIEPMKSFLLSVKSIA